VAAEFRGRVTVVKMNIDENPEIAGQLGVKSIPAVFAFKDGRPVDGFMGALPESQVRQFFDRIAGAAAPGVEDALAAAAKALADDEIAEAAKIYAAILGEDPRNTAAIGGLAKCYIEHGEFEHAAKTLAMAPQDKAGDPEITSARAALELAESAQGASADLAPLVARVESHPDDHAARVELAVALNAAGEREGALDTLIESIRRDRQANDAAARKQLLTFFEAWGPKDPLTLTGRRHLSTILFS
ncbi:FIG000875: Thioredoxin domain-containing protein EC-YbbN, partial [hydrothermal vent metagenome]